MSAPFAHCLARAALAWLALLGATQALGEGAGPVEVLGHSRDDGWLYAEQRAGQRVRLWAYHPQPPRLESSELPVAAPSPLLLPTGEGLSLDVRVELRRLLLERGELPQPLSAAAAGALGIQARVEPPRSTRGPPTLALLLPGGPPIRQALERGREAVRLELFTVSAGPRSLLVLATGPGERQSLHFAPAPTAAPLDLPALRRRLAQLEVKAAAALAEEARRSSFREDPSRFFGATKALRRALTLDARCLEAKLWLASLLALDEDLLEARRWLDAAAAQDPAQTTKWVAREPALQRLKASRKR